jgi:hypothetical protein
MKPSQSIALSALAAAWLAAMPAHAATQTRTVTTPGAHLCTLSIPTTDTGVRPKATGFRNEGTTNAFVICAFDSAPGQVDDFASEQQSDPKVITLYFASIDGKTHAFNCTGVNSWPAPAAGWAVPMQYSGKNVVVDPNDPYTSQTTWTRLDFGGTTYIPTSGSFSATCLLPPGVSILRARLQSDVDVGS